MKTIKEKTQKQYADFCEEVQNLTSEALKQRIVTLQQGLQESEDHKEANEALAAARATATELAGPYRDVKKAVKLKTQYILELLKDKGA